MNSEIREAYVKQGGCGCDSCVNKYATDLMRAAMVEKVQVGYLCSRGHFQMNDDPESDTCQSTNIAPIYVEIQDPVDRGYILENIQDALASFNRKLEEWRRG